MGSLSAQQEEASWVEPGSSQRDCQASYLLLALGESSGPAPHSPSGTVHRIDSHLGLETAHSCSSRAGATRCPSLPLGPHCRCVTPSSPGHPTPRSCLPGCGWELTPGAVIFPSDGGLDLIAFSLLAFPCGMCDQRHVFKTE